MLARFAGADRYSDDTFVKATRLLTDAEQAQARHRNTNEVMMPARQAVQTAEDARLIALQRQEDEAEAQQRASAKQREDAALDRARSEEAARKQAEIDRLTAEAARLSAERDRAAAEAARQAADAARLAADSQAQQAKALADQAARDKAAAEAARAAAESARAAAEANAAKAEHETVSDIIGLTAGWPFTATTRSAIAPTARIAACGGTMIAVNASTSNMPRLLIVKVALAMSAGCSRPACARSASSRRRTAISPSAARSALAITAVTTAFSTPIASAMFI